jgi:hypothetical protein
MTLTTEPHLLANFRDRNFFIHQEILGFCNSETRKVSSEGLTDSEFKESHEMRATHGTQVSCVFDLDRLRKTLVQKLKYRL